MRLLSLFIFILSIIIAPCKAQRIRGRVIDGQTQQALPACSVFLPDMHSGISCDSNGNFLYKTSSSTVLVQVSQMGYRTELLSMKSNDSMVTIAMTPEHTRMQEVIVSAPRRKLQMNSITPVQRLELNHLNTSATLISQLTQIAGVEQQSTGTSIGKPVIRGLTGNRIVVYAMDVRQENQQWGDEHGLGIGNIGIEAVEVIKGPSSLLYGSDALGGVLYFVDERYARSNSIDGQIRLTGQSVNRWGDMAGSFKMNRKNWRWNLFGDINSAADYKLPSGLYAHNTRYDEYNLKTSIGHITKHGVTDLRYSFIQNHFGLIGDTVIDETQGRKNLLPHQLVQNTGVSLSHKWFRANSTWHFITSYSENKRREFESTFSEPELFMKLQTITYALKWEKSICKNKIHLISGTQSMAQNNSNKAETALIPDSKMMDAGLFIVANSSWKKWNIMGGLRFDHRSIQTNARWEDSVQRFPTLNQNFVSPNFSFGISYVSGRINLRGNISSGYRSPNTSELSSNGVHEGVNRYEVGNKNLVTEHALQADLSAMYSSDHVQITINPFLNQIKNYITLSPTGDTLQQVPLYHFVQQNALLLGGEAGVHYHPHFLHALHFESTWSYLYGQSWSGKALPLIPPMKWNTTMKMDLPFKSTQLTVTHTYKTAQKRISEFETPTPSYHVFNATINLQPIPSIECLFGINNIFNTTYIDHLSRLKSLGIPAQGRNVTLSFKYSFHQTLRNS